MEQQLAAAGFTTQGGGGGGGGGQDAEAAAQRKAENEQARASMLKSILQPEALARRAWRRRHQPARPHAPSRLTPAAPPPSPFPAVNRVAIVKPENARAVEEHVIRLARSGKLGGPVDEASVIKMLEEVSAMADEARGGGGGVKKVTIVRRKHADSESEEEDF